MAILSPTNLETADYGTTGWNYIYSSNFQKLNNYLAQFQDLWSGTPSDWNILRYSSSSGKWIKDTIANLATQLATYLAKTDLSNVSDSTILNKIKNVDGSGSGLDADLLDGYHASQTPTANQIPVLRSDGSLYLPNTVGIGISSANSLLHVGGSISKAVTTVSGNVTLNQTHYTVLVNASSTAVTVNLPAASGCAGREYVIKKIDSSTNEVVIDGYESETIDGQLTYTLTSQWQFVRIQSDGTQWVIVGS